MVYKAILYLLLCTAQVSNCGSTFNCTGRQICYLDEYSLRFLILGDFGGQPVWPYYSFAQKRVAKRIAEMGEEKQTHFQIELGDNFYIKGPDDANGSRFQSTFEKVYKDSPAMYKPWYIVAGNHDHYGNIQAQIDYSGKSKRWIFPYLFYRFRYMYRNTMAEFIVIDTQVLCGNDKDVENGTILEALFIKSEVLRGSRKKRPANYTWLFKFESDF